MSLQRCDDDRGASLGSWAKILAGPLVFVLIEWLVRPDLSSSAGLASGLPPGATSASARHALAATAWIATWWVIEAIPIAVTSLLPLVLLPLLGLGTVAEVSRPYGSSILFLFLGGLLIAQAMESTGLHERIARRIIRLFGRDRRRLVLGYMLATAGLSMWISNTATAVMMLPIALAVLGPRVEDPPGSHGGADGHDSAFEVALLLGIAYAANIGGFGTPIGSPPTVVFQTIYEQKTGESIGFAEWMLYGVPLIVLLLPVTWWVLVRGVQPGPLGADRAEAGKPSGAPDARAAALGMTRDQRTVLVVFLSAAVLWLTRSGLGPLPSWGVALGRAGAHVGDSTVAIAAAILLFCLRGSSGAPILTWSRACPRLPWGVLLLMGAGFALSGAFDSSGLTLWMGQGIARVGELGFQDTTLFFLLVAVIGATSIVVTEFASNTASAAILLPIIFGASAALGRDRFPADLLMVGCALACTPGFAMPAGTPPNALVFGTERVSIRRFVRFGLLIDALALLLIIALMGAWYLLR